MKATLLGLVSLLIPIYSAPPEKDFFEEPMPVDLTIVAPLESVLMDRGLEEADYHDVWIILKNDAVYDTLPAELQVRGNFRRRAENCLWPPLKLKIKKSHTGSSSLGNHRKFKLVTNCRGERYLMREYIIYRMYEQLSPYSFQVRLVNLTLRDMFDQQPNNQQRGFMIEHKDELAERMDLEVIEDRGVHTDELDLEALARLKLFQYMIGNRDWDVYHGKNVKVFSHNGQPLAIPYDFDFCGSVDVPYSGLGDYELRSWTDLCWDEALRESLRQEFLEMIPIWQTMIRECEYLDADDRRKMLSYFKPFFKAAAKPKHWANTFAIECP